MSDDLLAPYRRTAPAASTATSKEADVYLAFGTKDRNQRLRIRCAAAPVQSPGYNILLNVIYDGDYGTNFVLEFTILKVLVQGRNLQKMIFAIENGLADYIQQYDADKWPQPKDEKAAFIQTIEIVPAGSGETQH